MVGSSDDATQSQSQSQTQTQINPSELLRALTITTTIEPVATATAPTATSNSNSNHNSNHNSNANANANANPVGARARPIGASLPTTIGRSHTIFGVPTHAFCQVFSDRIVLGVTQLSSGHIGSWVYCRASRSEIDPGRVDYELSTLLGGGGGSSSSSSSSSNSNANASADEKELYARRIAERLLEKKSIPGGASNIVLLLGISLPPIATTATATATPPFSSIERFKALVEVLVELIETAVGIALQQ